jgi:hypothetical protein
MATAIAVAIVLASTANADSSFMAGGYLISAAALNDWRDIAGFPLGFQSTNVAHSKAHGPISVRSDLGFLYNFSRTVDVPQANLGTNDKLQVETKNISMLFGVGPELSKSDGDLRPFAYGTVGFNTYWTSSNLAGTVGGAPYYASHGDSRLAFAWAAGLGIRRIVHPGESVELSAEYRSGGGHRYLKPSEITSSGATVNADRSARSTDQIVVRIGTMIGH